MKRVKLGIRTLAARTCLYVRQGHESCTGEGESDKKMGGAHVVMTEMSECMGVIDSGRLTLYQRSRSMAER